MLLGIDVFVDMMLHGRRRGPPGTTIAFETCFGWILAGSIESCSLLPQVTTCHVSCATGDEVLRKVWEIDEGLLSETTLSPEERSAVQHFKVNQTHNNDSRFIVPIPKRENARPLGESRSRDVHRFLSLERNLQSKNQFQEFGAVMKEYFELGHAEAVP